MEAASKKRCFIWGTGVLARQFTQFYTAELDRLHLDGYIDNNPEKWGKEFFGKSIYSPDILKEDGKKSVIIITKYKEEIAKQIKEKYSGYFCEILSEEYVEFLRKNPGGLPAGAGQDEKGVDQEDIIYGQIMGGLGNQLFIYSFCRQLVEKLNKRAVLYYDSGDGRFLEITAFPLDERITIIPRCFSNVMKEKGLYDRLSFCCNVVDRIPWHPLKIMVGNFFHRQGIIYIDEGYGKLDYQALLKKQKIVFMGYMQSEKFFCQVADQIRRELAVPCQNRIKEFTQKIEMAKQIHSELSVCIHIRRGDYLSDQFKDRFLVCTDDYYRKAVARMKERLPGASYYVFSDSIGWVKENMEYIRELNPVYVDNGGEQAVLDDFLMMKACRHFIMSNSTFSWWAQYLGTAPDKIVIAPSKWLNYGYGNRDIYQDNWELIDV